jgi:hypothetical protein
MFCNDDVRFIIYIIIINNKKKNIYFNLLYK